MWQVYKKEFLELARDKKTLIFTILMPTIVIPVIMFGMVMFIAKMETKSKNEVLTYAIFNSQEISEIEKELNEERKFKKVDGIEIDGIKQAIKDKKIKFAIVLEQGVSKEYAEGHQVSVALHFNDASVTNKIYKRVKEAIAEAVKPHKQVLLAANGISKDKFIGIDEPIKIDRVNTANKREDLGEKLGGLLPYLIIAMCLTGAMYPALDLGVGEKERGTLETLLITPVNRVQIVMAKFLVIFTTSFTAVFLEVISLLIFAIVLGQSFGMKVIIDVISMIGVFDVLMVLLMLIPVAVIFASILLAISIYARNYKEAQNYMSPIIMLAFLPIIIAMLPGIEFDWFWASVPLTNVALAIKEIVKGTIDYTMLLVIFASTTVVAGGLLYFCTRWFNKESVLFRT